MDNPHDEWFTTCFNCGFMGTFNNLENVLIKVVLFRPIVKYVCDYRCLQQLIEKKFEVLELL